MESRAAVSRFIVSGAHLSENLLHHKRSDVQRLLEDKGFEPATTDTNNATEHHYAQPGAPASDKQTIILFDDKGFVLEEDGVQLR